MQIMPNTGKMLATHFKTNFDHQDLLTPSTNIKYGSKYLKMMLDEHNNNPVLATASYNAGSFRVKSWLPEYDTAADAWIETIPFFETRNYVKNVLTYTVIYQQLLGKRPELRSKMPIIAGKKTS
jgi:soluble lytic murein transglycosylase